LIGELSRPAYQAAKPTWFDVASARVKDWLVALFGQASAPLSPVLLALGAAIIAAIVVAAFLLFGVPRRARRRPSAPTAIFGQAEDRGAGELRRDATNAAANGAWEQAVCDLFRASARTAADIGLVLLAPGTTATAFARQVATRLDDRQAIDAAARAFEKVRYAGEAAGPDDWKTMTRLDALVQGAGRPAAGVTGPAR
jgi:hypothetical protein